MTTTLDGITLEATAGNVARTVSWMALPWAISGLIMASLMFLLPFVYDSLSTDYSRCHRRNEPLACDGLRPTLDGRPFPKDRFVWAATRSHQLAAGQPGVLFDATAPLDHPSNEAFVAMAAKVSTRHSVTPHPDTRLLATSEATVLRAMYDAQYEANIAQATIKNEVAKMALHHVVWWGLLPLMVLGSIGLGVRRARDLRGTELRLTAHQVELNGQLFDQADVKYLELVGRRLVLHTETQTLTTSPLPLALIDDADALCVAFVGLDADTGGSVPEALQRLMGT